MIVKKISYTNFSKTKARRIGDLVDYIRQPHDRNPEEKVAYAGAKNFTATTHEGQRAEMISLAERSKKSRMPVSHWIFSWREGEQPTPQQVDRLVDIFLREMGLEGHQCIYALHHNTDNFHVHIAVNRMSPTLLKVLQPNKGFDREVGHKIVALVEHEQGWAGEKNARYTVTEGKTGQHRAAFRDCPHIRAFDRRGIGATSGAGTGAAHPAKSYVMDGASRQTRRLQHALG